MKAADRVLPLLSGVRPHGQNRWLALCPAHPDKHASLSVSHSHDRLLLKCWTGCTAADIVVAVGLTLADLFDNALKQRRNPAAERRNCAAQKLAEWREKELTKCGLELRTRDDIVRRVNLAVSDGMLSPEEAIELLAWPYHRYAELEFRFGQLLRNEDMLELWRETRRDED